MCRKKDTENAVQEERKNTAFDHKQKIFTIVGIALCVILIPILIINCTLLIKSLVNKDKVPDIGGKTPLIVLTESMEPAIKAGDLIICEDVEAGDIKVGDVISFFDPAASGTAVVTHRVNSIETKNGKLYFRTQGDHNNVEDRISVCEDDLVGKWTGTRLWGIGRIAMFMQSAVGLIICIGLPLVVLVAYELLRYKKANQKKQNDVNVLMAELEALKAAQTKQETENRPTEEESELAEGDDTQSKE